ncbi:MAG TPA: alpha/beta hydrolase [Flavobacterium sp.]|nr:alpha/beta hydrolase [Flavobacterium sp.]
MQKIKRFLLAKTLGFYLNTLGYFNPEKASLMAYRIFSEPRDGRLIKDQLPEVLLSGESQTFKYENDDLQAYVWKGNDHIILLVHGWESNASRWEKLLPYLQKSGSTIVAIDAPAHGLSGGKEFNVPRYSEFIEAAVQQFHPQVLIGHSIGGAACVYYQYKYQNQKLEKMVLLGAPSDMKKLASNYIELLSLNAKTAALFENQFKERFRFSLDEFSGQIFGKEISLKGIIAHDLNDEVVAIEEGKKIAGSWKNATFIETNGLGHSMHGDDLYQKVAGFIFKD